ncbi:MAG: histidinol-phosphate transaminase [Euryarchaeota archaeon]|nr:histidinol-phosphate transaminase [Euryarchaeota archaeon]
MSGTWLARRSLALAKAYAEEPGGGVILNNNSNIFPPNPAIEKALRLADPVKLAGYPSTDSRDLKTALSKRYGLSPETLVTANGSNEIIDLVIRAFTEPGDAVVFHPPTFEMIEVFARVNLASPVAVPLSAAFDLDVEGLTAAQGKVTFILRPNNPTGAAFPAREVMEIVKGLEGLVVVDEAYIEFAGPSLLGDLVDRGNALVLRTFSKAFGLAGFRVGWAAGAPPLIEAIAKVRGPFKLNAVSEMVAVAALEDTSYVDGVVAEVRRQRAILCSGVRDIGIEAFDSDANFVLMRPPMDAHAFARGLGERGLSIRRFDARLRDFVRVSVGPAEVTKLFLEKAAETVSEAPR